MMLDGAVEFADRGGEFAVLCHQAPQSPEHGLAQCRIIDAEHAPLAHDGTPGHNHLVDMAARRAPACAPEPAPTPPQTSVRHARAPGAAADSRRPPGPPA